ncbi:MAG: Ktr system potassium transporter B [Oleiphilaceae bacterium]|nr:Ktr system potassium transporter B [Oleiphilaceae bacterium]
MRARIPSFLPRLSESRSSRPRRINPPRVLIECFIAFIALGTCLLKLPFATTEPISWLEAGFTATSAITVTGLVVVDTGSAYTLFGQLVILTLIQFGGLGLMTFAVLTAVALGFRMSVGQQLVAREALNQVSLRATRRLGVAIALFAFAMEAVGFVLLAVFFVPDKGWEEGLYHAFFYAISAFNNSGFALSPDSLSAYTSHAGISLTVSLLFIIGGLGYVAVCEIAEKRSFSRLSVYSKIILTATLVLNLLATLGFLLLEYSNPDTLGTLEGVFDKLLASWFHGTTPRTAGFSSLDVGVFTAGTSVMLLLLMFIGGAPNSTCSGIKLSTFVILIGATRAFLRGNYHATIFNRSITQEAVLKALTITTIAMATIFIGIFILTLTVKTEFLDLAFEVVSAFGTVGLSRGATEHLGVVGQITIMMIMLIGRVGPLTLGYVLARRRRSHVRCATTEFPVG